MTPETLLDDLRQISRRAAADEIAADADRLRALDEARTIDHIVQACTNHRFTVDHIAIVSALVAPSSAMVNACTDYRDAANTRRVAADDATRIADVHIQMQTAGAAGAFYQGKEASSPVPTSTAPTPMMAVTPDNLDEVMRDRADSRYDDGEELLHTVNLDPVDGDDAPENPRFLDWSEGFTPDDDRRLLQVGNEDGETIDLAGVSTADLELWAAALAGTILAEEHHIDTFDPSDERAVLLTSMQLTAPRDVVNFPDADPDEEEEDFGRYMDWSTRLDDGTRRLEVGRIDVDGVSTVAIVMNITIDDLRRIHAQVVRTVLAHRKAWAEQRTAA